MLAAFEQANPNIKVELSVLPTDGYDEKMTTALGANQGAPDVALFWNSAWLPQTLNLDPLIAAEKFDKGQYIKGFWDTRTQFKGTTVGLPLGVGANFVMYNKQIYDEMGVAYPDINLTPEQWLELVPKLTDPAKKRWGGDRPRGPFRAIWFNMGARPFSDDSKTVEGFLNSEASVAAYGWLWDLVNSNATPTPADLDVLGTAGTGPVDLFIAGRLATATLNQGHMVNATDAERAVRHRARAWPDQWRPLGQCLGQHDLGLGRHQRARGRLDLPALLGRARGPEVPDGKRQPDPLDPVGAQPVPQGQRGLRQDLLPAARRPAGGRDRHAALDIAGAAGGTAGLG